MSATAVSLDVGGTTFKTSVATLRRYPGTFLDVLVCDRWTEENPSTALFIDRDPKHFRLILNYLRSGRVDGPDTARERAELLAEADFYGLADMRDRLAAQEQEERGDRADEKTPTTRRRVKQGDRVMFISRSVDELTKMAQAASMTWMPDKLPLILQKLIMGEKGRPLALVEKHLQQTDYHCFSHIAQHNLKMTINFCYEDICVVRYLFNREHLDLIIPAALLVVAEMLV